MAYVIHAYHKPLTFALDTHRWEAPPLEPIEVEDDFYAQKLVEHYGPVYGVIIIPSVKTRTGTHIDIDSAEKAANLALTRVENELVSKWVRQQQEDRVKAGLPVLPPTGRVDEIIRKNQVDLRARYGLSPVGYEYTPEGTVQAGIARADKDADADFIRVSQENRDLKASNQALQSEIKAANTIIMERLSRIEGEVGIES